MCGGGERRGEREMGEERERNGREGRGGGKRGEGEREWKGVMIESGWCS